ncbi:Armadillo repeat-containing protein 2 [Blyttiomyces sp. JEL0837]|nr:Armadillo repeat-containing protein 2 [Blyttiomyces sp. JEL0837]
MIQGTAVLRNIANFREYIDNEPSHNHQDAIVSIFVTDTVISDLVDLMDERFGLIESDELMLNIVRVLRRGDECDDGDSGDTDEVDDESFVEGVGGGKRGVDCERGKGKKGRERRAKEVGGDSQEDVEVLVKLIRLLANISIDPKAGDTLVEMMELEALVDLLYFIKITTPSHEELCLNIISALANFTYYIKPENCVWRRREEILSLLPSYLTYHQNPESILESTRLLSNLLQDPSLKPIINQNHVTSLLVTLLNEIEDRSILLNVCGCFVNLIGVNGGMSGVKEAMRGLRGLKGLVDGGGVGRITTILSTSLKLWDLEMITASGKAFSNILVLLITKEQQMQVSFHRHDHQDDDDDDDDFIIFENVISEEDRESIAICLLEFCDKATEYHHHSQLSTTNYSAEEDTDTFTVDEIHRILHVKGLAERILEQLGYGGNTSSGSGSSGGEEYSGSEFDDGEDSVEDGNRGSRSGKVRGVGVSVGIGPGV